MMEDRRAGALCLTAWVIPNNVEGQEDSDLLGMVLRRLSARLSQARRHVDMMEDSQANALCLAAWQIPNNVEDQDDASLLGLVLHCPWLDSHGQDARDLLGNVNEQRLLICEPRPSTGRQACHTNLAT
jgi:hypothetical protein